MTSHRDKGPAFVLPDLSELPSWLCPSTPPEVVPKGIRVVQADDEGTEEWMKREDERKREEKRQRERDRRRRIAAAQIAAGLKAANPSEAAKKGAQTKAMRRKEERKKERAEFHRRTP